MNRKTKIYLALIALGLVALGVDRFYFGATSPASTAAAGVDPEADKTGAPGRGHRAAPVGPPPKVAAGVPELRFPRDLAPFEAGSDIRDIFSRAGKEPAGKTSGRGGSEKSGPQSAAQAGPGREAFAAQHTLGAIMVVEGLRIAVVSGRWLRVGETLDTCTLIRVEGETAVFECHDGVAEFSVAPRRRKAKD